MNTGGFKGQWSLVPSTTVQRPMCPKQLTYSKCSLAIST